jgi:hypothetical protein
MKIYYYNYIKYNNKIYTNKMQNIIERLQKQRINSIMKDQGDYFHSAAFLIEDSIKEAF